MVTSPPAPVPAFGVYFRLPCGRCEGAYRIASKRASKRGPGADREGKSREQRDNRHSGKAPGRGTRTRHPDEATDLHLVAARCAICALPADPTNAATARLASRTSPGTWKSS